MAKDNRGAVALRALDLTQVVIAGAIGTTQSVVCRWIRGERKPDTKYRVAMHELYGIGWSLWDEDLDAEASGAESETNIPSASKSAEGSDPEAA